MCPWMSGTVDAFKWQDTNHNVEVILLKFWSLQSHKIKMDTKMKECKVAAKLCNILKRYSSDIFLNILQGWSYNY